MDTQFNRQLWMSFGIILGSIVIASGVLYYLAGGISGMAGKIVADRKLISQQTGAITTLAELKQDAAAAGPYEAAMDELLPTQDGLIGFPGWVQKIGNSDQVAVTTTFNPNSVSQNNVPGGATPSSIGFSLQAQGSAGALAAFLKDIQSQPGFFVQIVSFDLVGGGSNDMLSAQGNVYTRPD
jgi:hypothetical protein